MCAGLNRSKPVVLVGFDLKIEADSPNAASDDCGFARSSEAPARPKRTPRREPCNHPKR